MRRRDFLALGSSLALSGAFDNTLAAQTIQTRMMGGGGGGGGGGSQSPSVTPFTVPLPIPSTLAPTQQTATTDHYEITMRETTQEIIPGLQTTIWGYEGVFPGPVIRARSGRQAIVRQINNLPVPTTVHLHGGNIPAAEDGHPTDLIQPGSFRDYTYANTQVAAPLWFHDHTHEATGPHVYMGLAGLYLIDDEIEDALPLPKGENDVPLVIQDRLFDSGGSFVYPLSSMGSKSGVLGDTLLVNGAAQPYFQVGNRKVRFRIYNGSNARRYELALDSGQSFVQIGTDGGLLPHPVARTAIPLAPGERAEVVIDFSIYPVGTSVIMKNRLGSAGCCGANGTDEVMRFDVAWGTTDDSEVPADLRPLETLSPSQAVRTRTIDLQWQMHGGHVWVLNGRAFDPGRIDFSSRRGDVEIWHFRNQSGHPHPMHIHADFHQILDVDGRAPDPGDAGWKDTTLVPPWGSARVIVRFTDYLGTYVYHCHNLEHEDWAMMGQIEILS